MQAKKTPKANLETKKLIWIQLGLITALVIVFVALEWKSYGKRELDLGQREVIDITEEIIPITEQKVKPPPPPPPKQTLVINIVEDDVEIEDDDFEIDADADMDTEVEEYIPVEMDEDIVEEAEIFTVVESMPTYPGGESALYKYLTKSIQYPTMAQESGVQGRVYVTFVVEVDGSITDIRILRGIGGGCDEEAMRVVKEMPRWVPGKQRGQSVRVQFNLPVRFVLQ